MLTSFARVSGRRRALGICVILVSSSGCSTTVTGNKSDDEGTGLGGQDLGGQDLGGQGGAGGRTSEHEPAGGSGGDGTSTGASGGASTGGLAGAGTGGEETSGGGNGGQGTGGEGNGGSSTGGTGGETLACKEGTTVATSPPHVVSWRTYDGKGSKTQDSDAAGPVSVTCETNGADCSVTMVLSPEATVGRTCIDVSTFTGIEFDASFSSDDVLLIAGVSAGDPSGHCEAGADCYAQPRVHPVPDGLNVKIPLSAFQPAPWGVMAEFDPKQVLYFSWAFAVPSDGDQMVVSNVSFY